MIPPRRPQQGRLVPVRHGARWGIPLCALSLVLSLSCAEEAGKDGSQTHFTGADDSSDASTNPAPQGTADDSSDDDDSADDTSDDDQAADDDTSDDDTSDDDQAADDDAIAPVPVGGGSSDDADDDSTPGSGGSPSVPGPSAPTEPCTGDDCVEPYDGCAGRECGDVCSLCDPTSSVVDCPEADGSMQCDSAGSCVAGPLSCDPEQPGVYEACAGKRCGEPCVACDPLDASCVEAAEDTVCDAEGACVSGDILCSVERPICASTVFESTADACVEESWTWNGGECVSVTHCGCASGDCERLHPDRESCEAAYALCEPFGCEAQDARSGPNMCGTLEGIAFDGVQCTGVYCTCVGKDCEDISPDEETCTERFAQCLTRMPQCEGRVFPTIESDPGFEPDYPSFDFAVEGAPELLDPETRTVTAFADWTPAAWVGWEAAATPDFCVPVPPGRFTAQCPAARPLVLEVAGETVRLNVTLHWDLGEVDDSFSDVEVRISTHPSGTLMLQIREADSKLPVLMVVRGLAGAAGADVPWEFAPFTFGVAEATCATSPDTCNWTYSARDLLVSTGDSGESLTTMQTRILDVDGQRYAALHNYIFMQAAAVADACAPLDSWHQNLALVRMLPSQ